MDRPVHAPTSHVPAATTSICSAPDSPQIAVGKPSAPSTQGRPARGGVSGRSAASPSTLRSTQRPGMASDTGGGVGAGRAVKGVHAGAQGIREGEVEHPSILSDPVQIEGVVHPGSDLRPTHESCPVQDPQVCGRGGLLIPRSWATSLTEIGSVWCEPRALIISIRTGIPRAACSSHARSTRPGGPLSASREWLSAPTTPAACARPPPPLAVRPQ